MSPDRESALRAIEDRYGVAPGEAALGRLHLRAGSRRALPLHQPLDRAVLGYTREKWLGDYAIWDAWCTPTTTRA